MNKDREFRKILATYKKAWEQRNPALVMQIFSKDATYREDPFDEKPARGQKKIKRYWEEVVARHKNVVFTYTNIYTSSDQKVWACEWTAQYTKVETGERNTLKGVMFYELTRDAKKVRKFWEYWHIKGGRPAFTWRDVQQRTPQ